MEAKDGIAPEIFRQRLLIELEIHSRVRRAFLLVRLRLECPILERHRHT